MNRIELAQPDLGGNELAYVTECVTSGWVSSHGEFIGRFERDFARFVGVEHAVATNNGTTALHLALVALGVGPGDEVIVPTVTYVATANAVSYCGATPVLVDVEPGTLNLDVALVERAITSRTKGVIPVHLYGVPANVHELRALCSDRDLFVLEDAAEAHGAAIGDQRVGSLGDVGMFSFFGNKIITTGEGGIATTDDAELAGRLRLYRGQGMDPARRYWFPVIGYNYRMTNIQAALGVAQLERFEEFLARREALSAAYRDLLRPLADRVELASPQTGATAVPWLQNVYLRDADEERRDTVMASLAEAGIDTRPVFRPMHQLPPYRSDASFPVADDWAMRGISLPLHTALTESEVEQVCTALAVAVERL
ncbi:MAG TPA: DegT/DnrJ/EryC1/StrS family aminotransferase [Terrimesophilobacter sp.]|nr:DegT/DnrJ/EryC1/StrS family aminotransferase [Terrimesophilobacter sp.]